MVRDIEAVDQAARCQQARWPLAVACLSAILLSSCQFQPSEAGPPGDSTSLQLGERAVAKVKAAERVPPPSETAPGLRLSTLEGGRVVAHDGQFLGTITGHRHKDSIANDYGPYGDPYSPTSMYNSSSNYGSPHSGNGARHPHTPFPPRIYVKGKPVAYVTANRSFNPSIHPDALRAFADTLP